MEDSFEETLTYCDFPYEHWTRIRTNNVIERLNREIRRHTRVVGTFPDGNCCPHAGLCQTAPCGRHPVGQQEIHEYEALRDVSGRLLYCRLTSFSQSLQTNLRINVDSTLEIALRTPFAAQVGLL